ncbi:MAG TPA: ABC transporter permease [Spirochaetota bacterium]|nr:ABC transporter permease [Spirochaetota bacterium]HPL17216.1 ABC transporter permease [Spirochaetota bacterium]HRS76322.1 ABC transporter permease [Spirochaetota bacterium]HRT73955.1 ABC transporter permease [Spirochaetota bacterium]
MKIFLLICWRNLWRHRRRSLIVISSVAIGIFAMMLSMGILNGVYYQAIDNNINIALGHVSVQAKGFRDSMTLRNSFVPDETLNRALAALGGKSKGYAPRLKMQGMLNSSESSKGVIIVGVDPARERNVSHIRSYISGPDSGTFLPDAESNHICISRDVAEKLDVVPGDSIVVMVQDKNDEMVGVGMTVSGLFQTPIDSINQFTAFVGIRRLQEMIGAGDSISEINIALKNRDRADETKAVIAKAVRDPSLAVLTWKEMAPYLVSSIMVVDAMIYVSFGIIFITIVFSIANTLIMAIMERFHEIGVMKAIGTRPSWIFSLILFESVNLGMIGLVAGIVISWIVIGILSKVGINFSFHFEAVRAFGSGAVIYPIMRWTDVAAGGVIVMLTTVMAALYPARKGARIEALEAITFI